MPAVFAFVVTCKGRLHHLRQSLPRLVQQPATECVVVDYDCPDRTWQWVSENYPGVRVVHVTDTPQFHLSRARNLGAQAARAPWLCFVDADILLDEAFATTVIPLLAAGCYFRPNPLPWEAFGTAICARDDFSRVGGYDEAIEGWGGEDEDLYYRLGQIGLRLATVPGQLLRAIPHDDAERTAHYDVQNKWLNQRIASLYLHIKYDLGRQLGSNALSLASRQGIFRELRNTLLRDAQHGGTSSRFEVNLPDRVEVSLQAGWTIHRRWVYKLEPQPNNSQLAALYDHPRVVAYYAAHAVRKLHLGCGDHVLDSWLNTDLDPASPEILRVDVAHPLPFGQGIFEYIFVEHLLEHLSYADGERMLSECRRILKPGGILRLATPDLAFLVDLYRTDKSDRQQAYVRWATDTFLRGTPGYADTFVINNYVRDWGHQFIYDEKVLRAALAAAGFASVVRRDINESEQPELRNLENEGRLPPGFLRLETMVLEAVKPRQPS